MEHVNLPGEPDLSMMDRVPWIELSHAYGSAVDVPDQIRRLVTADRESRGGLLWGFTSNLFHQGSVYSATVAAIPIFQQLLHYRSVSEKPLILDLLANFALGNPEDLEQVDLNECVGHSEKEYATANDEHARECYLAVAAGVPLYAELLEDEDPRTVAAASYLMAFFPAHAFDSCPRLLSLAADERRPESVRSSALIACSYLDGGLVAEEYSALLSDLLASHQFEGDGRVPLLTATAAYCALRTAPGDETLRSTAEAVAEQALQQDIAMPDDGVYPKSQELDDDDLAGYAQQMLNPDEKFPWGDLVGRLQRATGKSSPALDARVQRRKTRPQRKRLDPSLYAVKPDDFGRENVLAAVRRMHAWLDVHRDQVPREVLKEFKPFQPHLDLVWDEVLKLLDSDDRFISTAAERLVRRAEPLSETAIGSLIDRLHDGDTRLAGLLKKHRLSQQQRQDMCDRLVSGRFEAGFGKNQQTYREIVCEQGSEEQVRELFRHGQGDDRSEACRELVRRELLDEHDPRVYEVAAFDCMSNDPGRYLGARFNFARSAPHQGWFWSSYGDLAPEVRWAVIEAMETFRADPTSQEEGLRTRIADEASPLLKAKMIRLMSHFDPLAPEHVTYLLTLLDAAERPIERSAVATTLGNWLGRGLDDRIIPPLLALTTDGSASVRRTALSIVARGRGPDTRDDDDHPVVEIAEAPDVLRRALDDEDEDVVRLAIHQLFRRKEWCPDDLTLLWPPAASDRVCSEAILAAALSPEPDRFHLRDRRCDHGQGCPLSASVLHWAKDVGVRVD